MAYSQGLIDEYKRRYPNKRMIDPSTNQMVTWDTGNNSRMVDLLIKEEKTDPEYREKLFEEKARDRGLDQGSMNTAAAKVRYETIAKAETLGIDWAETGDGSYRNINTGETYSPDIEYSAFVAERQRQRDMYKLFFEKYQSGISKVNPEEMLDFVNSWTHKAMNEGVEIIYRDERSPLPPDLSAEQPPDSDKWSTYTRAEAEALQNNYYGLLSEEISDVADEMFAGTMQVTSEDDRIKWALAQPDAIEVNGADGVRYIVKRNGRISDPSSVYYRSDMDDGRDQSLDAKTRSSVLNFANSMMDNQDTIFDEQTLARTAMGDLRTKANRAASVAVYLNTEEGKAAYQSNPHLFDAFFKIHCGIKVDTATMIRVAAGFSTRYDNKVSERLEKESKEFDKKIDDFKLHSTFSTSDEAIETAIDNAETAVLNLDTGRDQFDTWEELKNKEQNGFWDAMEVDTDTAEDIPIVRLFFGGKTPVALRDALLRQEAVRLGKYKYTDRRLENLDRAIVDQFTKNMTEDAVKGVSWQNKVGAMVKESGIVGLEFAIEYLPFVGGAGKAVKMLAGAAKMSRIVNGVAKFQNISKATTLFSSRVATAKNVVKGSMRAKRMAYRAAIDSGLTGSAAKQFAKAQMASTLTKASKGFAWNAAKTAPLIPAYAHHKVDQIFTDSGIGKDEQGNYTFTPTMTYGEALGQAYVDSAIEVLSESTGVFFSPMVGRLTGAVGKGIVGTGKWIGRGVSKVPGGSVAVDGLTKAGRWVGRGFAYARPVTKEVQKYMGFNGIIEESLEERVGDVARALTGVGDDRPLGERMQGLVRDWTDGERWLVELAAFSVMPVGHMAVGIPLSKAQQAYDRRQAGKDPVIETAKKQGKSVARKDKAVRDAVAEAIKNNDEYTATQIEVQAGFDAIATKYAKEHGITIIDNAETTPDATHQTLSQVRVAAVADMYRRIDSRLADINNDKEVLDLAVAYQVVEKFTASNPDASEAKKDIIFQSALLRSQAETLGTTIDAMRQAHPEIAAKMLDAEKREDADAYAEAVNELEVAFMRNAADTASKDMTQQGETTTTESATSETADTQTTAPNEQEQIDVASDPSGDKALEQAVGKVQSAAEQTAVTPTTANTETTQTEQTAVSPQGAVEPVQATPKTTQGLGGSISLVPGRNTEEETTIQDIFRQTPLVAKEIAPSDMPVGLRTIAKRLIQFGKSLTGISPVFYSSEISLNEPGMEAKGYIFLNIKTLEAIASGKMNPTDVLWHEWIHTLSDKHPQLYNVLKVAIYEHLKTDPKMQKAFLGYAKAKMKQWEQGNVNQQHATQNIDIASIDVDSLLFEEFVAQSGAYILESEASLKAVLTAAESKQKGSAKKLLRMFKAIWEGMKKVFKGTKAEDWFSKDHFNDLQKIFVDVASTAVATQAQAEQKQEAQSVNTTTPATTATSSQQATAPASTAAPTIPKQETNTASAQASAVPETTTLHAVETTATPTESKEERKTEEQSTLVEAEKEAEAEAIRKEQEEKEGQREEAERKAEQQVESEQTQDAQVTPDKRIQNIATSIRDDSSLQTKEKIAFLTALKSQNKEVLKEFEGIKDEISKIIDGYKKDITNENAEQYAYSADGRTLFMDANEAQSAFDKAKAYGIVLSISKNNARKDKNTDKDSAQDTAFLVDLSRGSIPVSTKDNVAKSSVKVTKEVRDLLNTVKSSVRKGEQLGFKERGVVKKLAQAIPVLNNDTALRDAFVDYIVKEAGIEFKNLDTESLALFETNFVQFALNRAEEKKVATPVNTESSPAESAGEMISFTIPGVEKQSFSAKDTEEVQSYIADIRTAVASPDSVSGERLKEALEGIQKTIINSVGEQWADGAFATFLNRFLFSKESTGFFGVIAEAKAENNKEELDLFQSNLFEFIMKHATIPAYARQLEAKVKLPKTIVGLNNTSGKVSVIMTPRVTNALRIFAEKLYKAIEANDPNSLLKDGDYHAAYNDIVNQIYASLNIQSVSGRNIIDSTTGGLSGLSAVDFVNRLKLWYEKAYTDSEKVAYSNGKMYTVKEKDRVSAEENIRSFEENPLHLIGNLASEKKSNKNREDNTVAKKESSLNQKIDGQEGEIGEWLDQVFDPNADTREEADTEATAVRLKHLAEAFEEYTQNLQKIIDSAVDANGEVVKDPDTKEPIFKNNSIIESAIAFKEVLKKNNFAELIQDKSTMQVASLINIQRQELGYEPLKKTTAQDQTEKLVGHLKRFLSAKTTEGNRDAFLLSEKEKAPLLEARKASEDYIDRNAIFLSIADTEPVQVFPADRTEEEPVVKLSAFGTIGVSRMKEAKRYFDYLKTAQDMLARGEDPRKIKYTTGWEYRAGDNKWKIEIDDAVFLFDADQLLDAFETTFFDLEDFMRDAYVDFRLDSMMEATEIFEAYPELKDVEIVFDNLRPSVNAAYSYGSNQIKINRNSKEFNGYIDTIQGLLDRGRKNAARKKTEEFINALNDTIAHEVQHHIQHAEGFAIGGSSDTFNELDNQRYRDRFIPRDKVKNLMRCERLKNKAFSVFDSMGLSIALEDAYICYSNGYMDEYNEIRDKMWTDDLKKLLDDSVKAMTFISNTVATANYEAYKRLAGEVEARNMANRRMLTRTEKLGSLMSDTELVWDDSVNDDVHIDEQDQIYLFDTIKSGVTHLELDDTVKLSTFDTEESADTNTETVTESNDPTIRDNIAAMFSKIKVNGSKQDISLLDITTGLLQHWQDKTVESQYYYDIAEQMERERAEILNHLTDYRDVNTPNAIQRIEALNKTDPDGYKKTMAYIVEADKKRDVYSVEIESQGAAVHRIMNANGEVVKEYRDYADAKRALSKTYWQQGNYIETVHPNATFTIYRPGKKKDKKTQKPIKVKVATVKGFEEAWDYVYECEYTDLVNNPEQPFTHEMASAVKEYRKMMFRAYAVQRVEFEKLKNSFVGDSAAFESWLRKEENKALFDLREELTMMGHHLANYMPRIRRGKYFVNATKVLNGKTLRKKIPFDSKRKAQAMVLKLQREMWKDVSIQQNSALGSEVTVGVEMAKLNTIVNNALSRMRTEASSDLEGTFRLKWKEEKLGNKTVVTVSFLPECPAEVQFAVCRLQGLPFGETKSVTFPAMTSHQTKQFKEYFTSMISDFTNVDTAVNQLANAVQREIAVTIKQSGSMARTIGRQELYGEEVVTGYEEDPVAAMKMYTASLASAKSRTNFSKKFMRLFDGSYYTVERFMKEHHPGRKRMDAKLYAEYFRIRRQAALTSASQPRLYEALMRNYQHIMKNPDAADKAISIVNGITSVMMLSRTSSAVVNTLALETIVPAAAKQYTGAGVLTTQIRVKKYFGKYIAFLTKKKLGAELNTIDRTTEIFALMDRYGLTGNTLAAETLATQSRSVVGKGVGSLQKLLMFNFAMSERLSRGATIATMYDSLCDTQGEPTTEQEKIDLLFKAKRLADLALGDFSKKNSLYITQGQAGRVLRPGMLFMTFGVNLVNFMLRSCKKAKGKDRAAAVAYLIAAQAVLGGIESALPMVLIKALIGLDGDDDGVDDPTEWVVDKLASVFGLKEKDSDFYKWSYNFWKRGLVGLAGVDVTASTDLWGVANTINKINMDDDELYASVGKLMLGAPGAVMMDAIDAVGYAGNGNYMRAVENVMPAAIKYPIRAYRESTEGVTTKRGVPVTYDGEQLILGADGGWSGGYDIFTRILGFNNADINEKRKQQWQMMSLQRKYKGMSQDIYKRIFDLSYKNNGEIDKSSSEWIEIQNEISKYNQRLIDKRIPPTMAKPITEKSIQQSLKSRMKQNKNQDSAAWEYVIHGEEMPIEEKEKKEPKKKKERRKKVGESGQPTKTRRKPVLNDPLKVDLGSGL